MLTRIALGLEYDGSHYQGWQSQRHGATVQSAVERALARVSGKSDAERVAVIAAGRTDTGVHASYQVLHFDAKVERPVSAWVRGTNAHLPADIVVNWAQPVVADFHARFSATSRTYHYVLINRPNRPAIARDQASWSHVPLDLHAMQTAAAYLLGEHDFSAFRSSECQANSPVRTITALDLEQRGDVFTIRITANAFLHHMVRNIVGTLVYVGKDVHEKSGRFPPEWMLRVLQMRDRTRAAPTFSAAGLYLTGIAYDDRFDLPQPGISNLHALTPCFPKA